MYFRKVVHLRLTKYLLKVNVLNEVVNNLKHFVVKKVTLF